MGYTEDLTIRDLRQELEKAETERNEWEARAVRAEETSLRWSITAEAHANRLIELRRETGLEPEDVADALAELRDQRDRAVEALRTAQAEFQGIAGSAGQPFIVRRASFASVDIQGAIAQLQPEAPRGVSDRSDASTTDHERTPQESSSGSSNSDTEDR